ncbi:hypothetical protein LINGRAPRIM_LOCUS402 [Linum grandiflorum]
MMSKPPLRKVEREVEVTALIERLAIYQCEQRLVHEEPVLLADCVPEDDFPEEGKESVEVEDTEHMALPDVLEEINFGTEDDPRPTFISAMLSENDRYELIKL